MDACRVKTWRKRFAGLPWFRTSTRALGLVASALIGVAVTSTEARPDVVTCVSGHARIFHADARSASLICDAADRTVIFLRALGIPFEHAIDVSIVPALELTRTNTLGFFDWQSDHVSMLPLDEVVALTPRANYRTLAPEDIYLVIASHELAHAIASDAFTIERPSRTAQEYIAAVVQIGILEHWKVDRLLSSFPGRGFRDPAEINLFVYQMDPLLFAVSSYRHFVAHDDGLNFVNALLSGEMILSDLLFYSY